MKDKFQELEENVQEILLEIESKYSDEQLETIANDSSIEEFINLEESDRDSLIEINEDYSKHEIERLLDSNVIDDFSESVERYEDIISSQTLDSVEYFYYNNLYDLQKIELLQTMYESFSLAELEEIVKNK